MMITSAINNLHFKRTTDTADLNENEEKQKWEIIRILDKRWTRERQEYKMRWEDTWLRRSELENAQKLLQEFERKDWAQRECKRGKSTRTDMSRWSLTTSFAEKIHMFLILSVVISFQISILSVRLFPLSIFASFMSRSCVVKLTSCLLQLLSLPVWLHNKPQKRRHEEDIDHCVSLVVFSSSMMLDATIIFSKRFSFSFHTNQAKAYLCIRHIFFLISQLLSQIQILIILAWAIT